MKAAGRAITDAFRNPAECAATDFPCWPPAHHHRARSRESVSGPRAMAAKLLRSRTLGPLQEPPTMGATPSGKRLESACAVVRQACLGRRWQALGTSGVLPPGEGILDAVVVVADLLDIGKCTATARAVRQMGGALAAARKLAVLVGPPDVGGVLQGLEALLASGAVDDVLWWNEERPPTAPELALSVDMSLKRLRFAEAAREELEQQIRTDVVIQAAREKLEQQIRADLVAQDHGDRTAEDSPQVQPRALPPLAAAPAPAPPPAPPAAVPFPALPPGPKPPGCPGARRWSLPPPMTKEEGSWQLPGLEVASPAPEKVSPGAQVGPCRLRELIGSGTCALVYSAANETDLRLEAIKVLDKSRLQQEAAAEEEVQRELSNLARVQPHDQVVALYGACQGPTHVFFRMEFVGRRNLVHYVNSEGGFLEPDKAKVIQYQLALALAHCHCRGVAHRDVKLENIGVVDRSEHIKLLDFGSSCLTEQRCVTTSGTLPFASPEAVAASQRAPYAPAPCDVWSAAVVLFEMLCTIGAFSQLLGWGLKVKNTPERAQEVLQFLRESPDCWRSALSEHWSNVPQALLRLFDGMFETDPSRRWSAAQVAASEWVHSR